MKKAESKHLPALFIRSINKNIIGFTAFLILWLVLSFIFPEYIIPPPWKVLENIPQLFTASFLDQYLITLKRLLTGFLIAFAGASIIGILSYRLKIFDYTENILSLFQVIPGAVLGIIFLIIFGIGDWVPVSMIIAMSIPIMTINTTTGLRKVSKELQEVIYVFGGSTPQVFRYVYIPALIPVFRSNFLIGSGIALKVIVLGEYIGCEDGIGFLLNNARTLFQMENVFFYLLIIMLTALVFQLIINIIFVELFKKYLD